MVHTMMGGAGKNLCLALLVLLSDCGNSSAVGEDSTCETTGTVFEGEPATVTCHFHRPHQKFMVYRLGSASDKEIVTVCTHTDHGLDCDLPEGHTVTTTANNQAVLHIASARQESSGKYFCKTLPAWEDNADNCTLVVQSNILRNEGLVTCKTNAPVSAGQKCWLRCDFAKNVRSTGIMLVKEPGHGSLSEEEILVCDKAGDCILKKEGYELTETNTTHVAVSIPHLQTAYTGNYKCKSATIKGISHGCQLQMQVSAENTSDGSGVSTYIFVVIGTLVAVLFATVLISVLVFIYRSRIFSRRAYIQAPTTAELSTQ